MKLLMTALMARFGVAIHTTGWGTLIRSDDLSDGGTAILSGNPGFFHLVYPVQALIGR